MVTGVLSMDYLQVGNIDLDIFSPNTQKVLVTLDDIPEENIAFSMDFNCEFLLSDDGSSVVSNTSVFSVFTPKRKSGSSQTLTNCIFPSDQYLCHVCKKRSPSLIECAFCSNKCQKRCMSEILSSHCCYECKTLPLEYISLK